MTSKYVAVRLLDIWRTVLKAPEMSEQDSFFSLGGDSLSALNLLALLDKEFSVRIRMRDLFENPTVSDLAAVIEQAVAGSGDATGADPEPAASGPLLEAPLAPVQDYFWRVYRALPDSTFFVQITELECGGLDLTELLSALHDVVARQDALRCTYHAGPSGPVQRRRDEFEIPVHIEALRYDSPQQRRERVRDAMAQEIRTPFDLSGQLPIRARVLRHAPDDQVLLVMTHHIAFDGLSRQIMVRDLADFYRHRMTGTAAPPPLRYSFLRYATHQRVKLDTGQLDEAIGYWNVVLNAPTPDLLLPGGSRPTRDSYRTRLLTLRAPVQDFTAAQSFAKRHGVTFFTVLLSAFVATVAQNCGVSRVPVSLQVANRDDPKLSGLIGPFANTLIVLPELPPSADFTAITAIVDAALQKAYDVQETPLEIVASKLRESGAAQIDNLLRIGFAMHEPLLSKIEVPGGELTYKPWAGGDKDRIDPTTFDLAFEIRPGVTDMVGQLHYKLDVYSDRIMERLWRQWCELLGSAVPQC